MSFITCYKIETDKKEAVIINTDNIIYIEPFDRGAIKGQQIHFADGSRFVVDEDLNNLFNKLRKS